MSYRQWRSDYRRRVGGGYVKGYPWSIIGIAASMGVLGVAVLHNVLAGTAGAVGTAALGLWYWKPGGPGRRSIEDA